MPDILNPPNGWRSTSAPVILRLMYRLPTRNSPLAPVDVLGAARVEAAGQGVGRAVGDLQRLLEAVRPQHGQDGAEDFFLAKGADGATSAKMCGATKQPSCASAPDVAGVDEPALALALLDGAQDAGRGPRRR